MIGTCSEFGGANDKVMRNDSGLAFYEPWEADRRPDMFFPEDKTWIDLHPEWKKANPDRDRQPTWARLKTDFFYIALRIDNTLHRTVLQNTPFRVRNTRTGDWCIAFLVDRGPGVKHRLVDVSPGLARRLQLKTDDLVDVTMLDVSSDVSGGRYL